jgi:glycosyltransferase involved in cell wall biosynthesis
MYNAPSEQVAFISNGLKVGGAERFSINLVNALAKRGHKALVISLSGHNPLANELDPGIEFIAITRLFRYDVTSSWKIRRIIRQRGITKVFCVESFPLFMGKLALYFNSNVRFYLSLHNSLPISKGQRIRDIVYLSLFRKNDIALFICRFQKDCFRTYYNFSPADFEVVYNGTDMERYHYPDPQFNTDKNPEWKESLGLKKTDKTVLMVGRISIEKSHTDAVKALSHLHKKLGTMAHLVIVGGGDSQLLAEIKNLVAKEKLQQYVHFLGSHSDVRPFLQYADLFTLTSFSETFSLAALEAMASGLPVSLTDVGGASEMVTEKSVGELSQKNNPVRIAETWNTILMGHYDRAHISNFTRKNFSLTQMIDQYEHILGFK